MDDHDAWWLVLKSAAAHARALLASRSIQVCFYPYGETHLGVHCETDLFAVVSQLRLIFNRFGFAEEDMDGFGGEGIRAFQPHVFLSWGNVPRFF